jgi:hypothetical protein
MNSYMLKKLQSQNPDKEYPCNLGKKWTDEEESLLLEELQNNIDIETISQNHNRTIGGINSRRNEIAYKMYVKNITMEEICERTKVDSYNLKGIIIQYEKKSKTKSTTDNKETIIIESKISEMKNEIKELKNTIKELVEMMKAVYEFENA